jgi:hypothetical protein
MSGILSFVPRVFGSVGTVASLIALAISFKQQDEGYGTLRTLLIVAAIGFFILDVHVAFRSFRADRAYTYTLEIEGRQAVRRFMHNWIESSGRTAIFSRDMSWASEPDIADLLRKKAASGELTICVPTQTALTSELELGGAEILTYGRLRHVPRSRFTIRNYGRGDAEVAIGLADGNSHRIRTYQAGRHPAFQTCEDLVEVIRKLPAAAR